MELKDERKRIEMEMEQLLVDIDEAQGRRAVLESRLIEIEKEITEEEEEEERQNKEEKERWELLLNSGDAIKLRREYRMLNNLIDKRRNATYPERRDYYDLFAQRVEITAIMEEVEATESGEK